jgi:hypothetical protein
MSTSLIQLLEPLIGSTLAIDHRRGTVIDILEDPPSLVMSSSESQEEIRLDHLGRPQETSVPSWTVSLFSKSGNALHPDLQRQLHPDLAVKAHEFLNNRD